MLGNKWLANAVNILGKCTATQGYNAKMCLTVHLLDHKLPFFAQTIPISRACNGLTGRVGGKRGVGKGVVAIVRQCSVLHAQRVVDSEVGERISDLMQAGRGFGVSAARFELDSMIDLKMEWDTKGRHAPRACFVTQDIASIVGERHL